jgi:hypothetical protein
VQLALFLDALVATGNPSRALQAWIVSMTRQQYYDTLTRFALAGEARYAQSVPRFLPVRWSGFITVVVMVVCHVIVIVY